MTLKLNEFYSGSSSRRSAKEVAKNGKPNERQSKNFGAESGGLSSEDNAEADGIAAGKSRWQDDLSGRPAFRRLGSFSSPGARLVWRAYAVGDDEVRGDVERLHEGRSQNVGDDQSQRRWRHHRCQPLKHLCAGGRRARNCDR